MSEEKQVYQHQESFQEVQGIIQTAQREATRHVNKLLIGLYWSIGCFVSEKINACIWGENVVTNLSEYLLSKETGIKGFSARNIWRMKQLYETYKDKENLSALLTEISWSNHLHILSKTKSLEEKVFYLELAAQHSYSEREFARVIDSGTFERTLLANKKLSALLTEFFGKLKNAIQTQKRKTREPFAIK